MRDCVGSGYGTVEIEATDRDTLTYQVVTDRIGQISNVQN